MPWEYSCAHGPYARAESLLDLSELGEEESEKDEKSGVSISDFEIIKPISRGSFGYVHRGA